ncbi:MAG: 3-phosphoshikimate 1-carboxyvinyltransferase [Bacteroidetes bacterium]|nr:3-phosphoshikimate 1-carboxyvinyltransferase [Bacteroidota bacterium]
MRNSITIRRPEAPVDTAVDLPRSKSVANRALILASLAGDLACVMDPGDADDTRILLQLLRERPRTMHCGLGGTTFRFLLAWAAVQEGEEHAITGEARLLERPHDPLVDGLRRLGADIERTGAGFRVRGRRMAGGTLTLDAPASSQFVSALMLIGPCLEQGLHLQWTGRQLSRPYVEMTARAMRHFGASVELAGASIRIGKGGYRAAPLVVPRDWSAAAFWLECQALLPAARIVFPGLARDGWQGDEAAIDHWASLTATDDPHPVLDLTATPDLFQPLAFTCAALGRNCTFTGLDNLPLKETDRLAAVADALRTLGCGTRREAGTFTVDGRITNAAPPPFDPQGDHRMAMALAPLAAICEAITVLDPEVVRKSYPGFWDDLRRAGFRLREGDGE